MQREEIRTLQSHLRDWYGIEYQPRLREDGRAMIAQLEQARPGADFDRTFLMTFSRHHYSLMEPVNGCTAGADLSHSELREECRAMWHAQMMDIHMMRQELKRHFNIADWQPFRGLEPLRTRGEGRGGHDRDGD